MKLCKVVSYCLVVPSLKAPLKPPTNFKFKHFYFIPIKPSSPIGSILTSNKSMYPPNNMQAYDKMMIDPCLLQRCFFLPQALLMV